MKWFSIKNDGIPDWTGEYLVRHIKDGWPLYLVARIDDEHFYDEVDEMTKLHVTHWAKIDPVPVDDEIPD